MLTLGILVNPFAGIGGSVALKGSDGAATRAEALRRGAQPQAMARMTAVLSALRPMQSQLRLLTWGGAMGEQSCRAAGMAAEVLGSPPQQSEAADTRHAAAALAAAKVDVILFAGGDGTARDLVDTLDPGQAVLGVPAGCKMHSAVYAVNPSAAAALISDLLSGKPVPRQRAEVRDIDEDAFRDGVVRARHYGELTVLSSSRFVQQVKSGGQACEALDITELAAGVVDRMEPGVFYFMGSGSTVAEVMSQLGLPNTLLGVDVVCDGERVASDQTADQLLAFTEQGPCQAVVTVIGGQGHLFGRGNQQFSPAVIRALGREHITVLVSPQKLDALSGRPLLLDTGDAVLDRALCGLWALTCGYDDQVFYRAGDSADETV